MAYSLISKKEIKEHTSDAAKQFFSCPHVVESPKHTRDISMGIHKPIGDVTIVMSLFYNMVWQSLSCSLWFLYHSYSYHSIYIVAWVVRATHKHTGCWNVSWAYCFCRSAGSTTCISCISSLILQTSGPMNLTQQVMQSSNGGDVGKGTRLVKSGQISPTC